MKLPLSFDHKTILLIGIIAVVLVAMFPRYQASVGSYHADLGHSFGRPSNKEAVVKVSPMRFDKDDADRCLVEIDATESWLHLTIIVLLTGGILLYRHERETT